MYTLGITGLVAGYVLLGLVLLSINLYSRWPWWVKAVAIVLVSAFYIVTYFSLPQLLGWPTNGSLPERFRLLAVHIQEPSKITGAEGRIFLWASDMTGPVNAEPRAYEVAYSPPLHEKAVEAGTKLRKGMPQLGELKDEDIRGGKPQQAQDSSQMGQKSVHIEFYDLPDPLFPEK